MASSAIVAGLGLAVIGFAGRAVLRAAPTVTTKMNEVLKQIPTLNTESILGSKYYKGGFDAKMSKREAALILGVSPTANKLRIKEAHKRIMLLNHPDKGGSPYLAAKINEAKDYMDTTK
uniref:EOG090X0MNL n=1 Tax=Moina brachiata TaxID=675436 RepID=A0A4Y7NME3_9CRUS|nr:EOG090X0MNL [Moina brachiata]SVE93415.1 EOG090X0MNL [Moina brachiata]